ncbi:protein cornichon homolog 4 [Aethina tumida]|uniref:protein cornichon homolog 4 n=1 Tax=Aethina tumida TaxID=116153 RepID=UPI00096AE5FE|nr:protein cornichon homolog 4 [Aethina tumida]
MLEDSFNLLIQMLNAGIIVFWSIFHIITLSDFECDYLNARECCSRMNLFVRIKLFGHIFPTVIFLITGHTYLCLINLPITVFLIYELLKLPSGNMGLYDPTEIHKREVIHRHMKNSIICGVFYLAMFFIYMYCLIQILLEGDPIRRSEEEEMLS